MGNLNIPLQSRVLSQKEKDQLVGKLLACPTMRERSLRNRVVQELRFADSVPGNPDATDKDDVMDIVNRCLNFSDGLQQLVERIEYREENSLPMQQLRTFLEILFSSPDFITINVDLLVKLYALTANVQVAKDHLHNLYRQSIPDGRLPRKYQNTDEGKTLPLMIQDLAQAGLQSTPSHSGLTHPLLTFLKLLSHCVPDSVGNLILQWREETAAGENIALAEESRLDITIQQTTENPYYLLVKFKPSDDKRDEFEIHAWLICEHNGKTVLIDGYVKEEATLEEMPSLLDKLISQCQEHTNTFTIELFLPFTLLNCDKTDVHTWKLDYGWDNTIAMSHKYPLVLRSYDRIYGMNKMKPELRRRLRQAWESNWAILESCGKAILRWPLKESDSCKDNLVAWLQEAACLTMMFVPPTFNEVQPHIFKKMVSAGTSVALWPRLYLKHLNEEAVEQAYCSLLEGCNFSTLPKMIWERRKKALMDETLPANHLTLFWDDPYRLPSDAPDAPSRDKYPLAFPRERK